MVFIAIKLPDSLQLDGLFVYTYVCVCVPLFIHFFDIIVSFHFVKKYASVRFGPEAAEKKKTHEEHVPTNE